MARLRLLENPFYVLELRPTATRAEIERQGQKLLGMLELGLAGSARYRTPLGVGVRTAEMVRKAVAELREPERRLLAEVWARLEVTEESTNTNTNTNTSTDTSVFGIAPVGGFADALAELGLGRRP
jgi:hypothetical protein